MQKKIKHFSVSFCVELAVIKFTVKVSLLSRHVTAAHPQNLQHSDKEGTAQAAVAAAAASVCSGVDAYCMYARPGVETASFQESCHASFVIRFLFCHPLVTFDGLHQMASDIKEKKMKDEVRARHFMRALF